MPVQVVTPDVEAVIRKAIAEAIKPMGAGARCARST
jgi:hypothetical protein